MIIFLLSSVHYNLDTRCQPVMLYIFLNILTTILNSNIFSLKVLPLFSDKFSSTDNDDCNEEYLYITSSLSFINRSLLRATMKNTIISLFFPMLLPFHTIANHNRLIYDVAIGTIVIERL